MSDITRQQAIYYLKAMRTMCVFQDAYGQPVDTDVYDDALEMAIDSLEVDEAYQLEYERTSEQSDKRISEHHRKNIEAYAHDFEVSKEQAEKELRVTTKNDLAVDCIVDVLGSYTDLDIPYKREIAENILTKLSSVTPQERKTGHWILTSDDDYEYCTCSKCGYQNGENWMIGSHIKFCEECGAKMVEPQESEYKG